jgi:hypothetical protein
MVEVKQPLTDQEWALYRLITTPSIFSEFIRSTDRQTFTLWPKQIHEMNREDLHKRRIQARDLGKSITAMDEVNSLVMQYEGAEDGVALVGTRADPNLQPIFEKFVALYERNRLMKFWLKGGERAIDRKHFEIRLANNAIIKGRIQGKDGQGFNTVHPNIAAWLDEAQLLDDAAVGEFYGMINANLPVLVSGVPNGVRTSWAYRIDNDDEEGFVGGNMTRLEDPRVTPEFLESLKKAYGGETSNMYQQKVLGMWGADARMTFDLERIEHDLPLIPGERGRQPSWYHSIQIDGKNYEAANLPFNFSFRDDMPKAEKIYIAADHGDTGSPTTAYVHFFDAKERCWRQYVRFLLYGMQAPRQAEVFHFVTTELERITGITPIIGLDTTGQGGQAVAALIEDQGHTVVWANVSENVKHSERLENDEEYLQRITKDPFSAEHRLLVPVQMPLRQVAIPHILIPNLYNGSIRVVEQEELWKQFGGTIDHEDRNGKYRIFETDWSHDGDPHYNHDLSAFEVFAAMILLRPDHKEEAAFPEVWIEEMPIAW